MNSLLESTKADAEKVFSSVNILLQEAEKQQEYSKQIEQAGHVLAQKKQEFDTEKQAFKKEKETFESEKQFLVKQSAQNKVNEAANIKAKNELEVENRELDKKREEIAKQDAELGIKIKQYQGLEEQKQDIEAKIALMEQEKVIDRERKTLLDIRENKINERAKRLQIEAEL